MVLSFGQQFSGDLFFVQARFKLKGREVGTKINFKINLRLEIEKVKGKPKKTFKHSNNKSKTKKI